MPDSIHFLYSVTVIAIVRLLIRRVNLDRLMNGGSDQSNHLCAALFAEHLYLSVPVLTSRDKIPAVGTVPLKYLPIIIHCHLTSLLAYLPVLPGEPP